MTLRLKANRRFPSIPVVVDTSENHTQVLMAVKEALDIGQRRTGDLLNSFIRVEDLIDLGLITIEGNTNAIVGADLAEIANIGDLSGSAAGDFLRFDGTDWVNDQLALGDITQAMVLQHQVALLRAHDGSAAVPAFSFSADTDTGIYRSGADNFGFAAGGVNVLDLYSGGIVLGGTFTQLDAVPDQPYSAMPLAIYSSPFIGGFSSQNAFFSTRYGTSLTAPTAIGSGLTLGGFSGLGYDGTATARGAFFFMLSTEAWTSAGHGAGFEFRATPVGSVTDAGITANRVLQIAANSTGGYARGVDGAVSQPFFSFVSDSDCGMYRVAANSFSFAAGGASVLSVQLTGSTRIVTVGDGTNTAQLVFRGAAGSSRDMAWQTGSLSRWIARANSVAESGANAGSDFDFTARDDAGAALLTAWSAIRATGQMRFRDGTNAIPAISFQSDPDTGIYWIGANNPAISAGGVLCADFTTVRAKFHTPVRLQGYTVATLPAGAAGDTAYVTDALAPAFLTAVVGGGAVVCSVFHDGTNWIVQ